MVEVPRDLERDPPWPVNDIRVDAEQPAPWPGELEAGQQTLEASLRTLEHPEADVRYAHWKTDEAFAHADRA